jgi:hypothetical protein
MPQPEKLPPGTEQMKAWSAALTAELRGWPRVTQKSFFGFTALYRGRTMFGLLPRTPSLFQGNAVAFGLDRAQRLEQTLLTKDSRVAAFDKD